MHSHIYTPTNLEGSVHPQSDLLNTEWTRVKGLAQGHLGGGNESTAAAVLSLPEVKIQKSNLRSEAFPSHHGPEISWLLLTYPRSRYRCVCQRMRSYKFHCRNTKEIFSIGKGTIYPPESTDDILNI